MASNVSHNKIMTKELWTEEDELEYQISNDMNGIAFENKDTKQKIKKNLKKWEKIWKEPKKDKLKQKEVKQ